MNRAAPGMLGPAMDLLIMHDSDRYDLVRDIGSSNFDVARLLKYKVTNELVAVKYIERGDKIDENVQREIINHRSLRHPNIVRFRVVVLTPTHLAIVLEYASGGELFDRICNAGRFNKDEARFFFQQLISGAMVCLCYLMYLRFVILFSDVHSFVVIPLLKQVCHRDLKLENTLLDGSHAPRLKICDFGYSKMYGFVVLFQSSLYYSQPKSTVGTPAYIAPEVLLKKEYDGKLADINDLVELVSQIADVWSCGVTLYVMLMGGYPFEDPYEPKDFRRMIQRILTVQYSIPDNINISLECRHLLSRIVVGDPTLLIEVDLVIYRFSVEEIGSPCKATAFPSCEKVNNATDAKEVNWIDIVQFEVSELGQFLEGANDLEKKGAEIVSKVSVCDDRLEKVVETDNMHVEFVTLSVWNDSGSVIVYYIGCNVVYKHGVDERQYIIHVFILLYTRVNYIFYMCINTLYIGRIGNGPKLGGRLYTGLKMYKRRFVKMEGLVEVKESRCES
ncbi:uncharacterized protein [Phyllobates terribilis]|uniref:uncharacterized protein n=1 Tax=Phyllobates terribilis TaxID=111132 RepID=UPI003CCB576D